MSTPNLKRLQSKARSKRYRDNIKVAFNLGLDNDSSSSDDNEDVTIEKEITDQFTLDLNNDLNENDDMPDLEQRDNDTEEPVDNLSDDFEQLSISDDEPSSDDERNERHSRDKFKPIYNDAKISLDDFNFAFMALAAKMNLNMKNRQTLIVFIKAITPAKDNLIPDSYYKLKKTLNIKEEEYYNSCNICSIKIDNDSCICTGRKNKQVTTYKFELFFQLSNIVDYNYTSILKYKGNVLIYFAKYNSVNINS